MPGIYDFTDVLPKNNGDVIFNPSVARWYNDYYVCVYRVFNRYGRYCSDDIYKDQKDPEYSDDHPWKKDKFWRINHGGYDLTKVVILKIKNESNISFVEELCDLDGVDARILYLYDDNFLISMNQHFNGIFGIVTSIISIETEYINNIKNYKVVFIDNNNKFGKSISKSTEKNWSFWVDTNNNIWFSYGISGKFAINYLLKYNENTIQSISKKVFIKDNIKSIDDCLIISTSTPSINYGRNYLAVGHIKYSYKKIRNPKLEKFHKFITDDWKLKTHPYYVYLMFFYLFNEDHEIISYSPYFMLRDREPYSLCFASGLTDLDGNYLISYGSYDTKCKMTWFTSEQVNELLNYESDTFMIVDPGDDTFIHYSSDFSGKKNHRLKNLYHKRYDSSDDEIDYKEDDDIYDEADDYVDDYVDDELPNKPYRVTLNKIYNKIRTHKLNQVKKQINNRDYDSDESEDEQRY